MDINILKSLKKRIYQGDECLGLPIFITKFVESFGLLTMCLYEFDKDRDLKCLFPNPNPKPNPAQYQ